MQLWRFRKGKLLFALCRSCSEDDEPRSCNHTWVEVRVLIGTWLSQELSKAIDCRYKILQRIETWHYPNVSKYDPKKCSGGIWTAFTNKWVKLKQKASGYPKDCNMPEERVKYVTEWKAASSLPPATPPPFCPHPPPHPFSLSCKFQRVLTTPININLR